MLFVLHSRCGDLGWSRGTAGGMLCASSPAVLDVAVGGNAGQGGISLRQKCADLRLNLPPGSSLCSNQSNKLLCPVPCTLQLLCPSL